MPRFQSEQSVLIILSNCRQFPYGENIVTGTNAYELTMILSRLVYQHKWDMNRITFATPMGGEAPLDPRSLDEALRETEIRKLFDEMQLGVKLSQTRSIQQVMEENKIFQQQTGNRSMFQAVIIPGGHGLLFDLTVSEPISVFLSKMVADECVIGTICHGAAALFNIIAKREESQPPTHYIYQKKVTSITVEEEKLEGYPLPFHTQHVLERMGAKFEKNDSFKSFVVVDGRLVTAQNNESIEEFVATLLKVIQSK